MNALSLPDEIWVESAKHHTRVVVIPISMELKEVATIVRQQDPAVCSGERQHLRIRHGRVCVTGVHRGQYIISEAAQFHHDLKRNVLVGIKPGH